MSILNGRMIGLVSRFAPQVAQKMAIKKAFAALVDSAYKAGSVTSRAMRQWLPWRGAPDGDYNKTTQKTIVARSRDAHRNQPLARGVIERLKHNTVGTGIRPQSKIDYHFLGVTKEAAAELEQQIEREFYNWANGVECDLEREMNFWSIQALAYVSWLVTGDVLVNTPFHPRPGSNFLLKLQLIEGDRLENPNGAIESPTLSRGVERDRLTGAPVAYHVTRAHPNDPNNFAGRNEYDRLIAFGERSGRRRVLHLKEKDRPGQTRGVPLLAPVLELFKKADRYSEAEIDAAITASFLTVFVKNMGSNGLFPSLKPQSEYEKERGEITLDTAAVVQLEEGEDVTVANPTRPNAQYDPFITAILTEIGSALGMPIEFLRLSFTASFSAARAALIQAWKLIMYHRRILVDYFCQPIWELFVDELIASGRLNVAKYSDPARRAALCRARWVGIAKGALKEIEEVKAAQVRVQEGFSTRQRECEEMNGSDWLENTDQLGLEQEKRKEKGLVNANKFGNDAAGPSGGDGGETESDTGDGD